MRERIRKAYILAMDFMKKCNDDHVAAFGSMSAFFMMLSFFPFMIFFLTLTRYAPFTKDDVLYILTDILSFEKKSLVTSLVNEVYRKSSASVFTISILAALWSASRGVYAIVKGLNSVYDIDDNRNFFAVRIFSLCCTVILAVLIVGMLALWLFGNGIYAWICEKLPMFSAVMGNFMHKRLLLTVGLLTLLFMLTYKFVPARKSHFLRQWPGALSAALGWVAVSAFCSLYLSKFSNFTYIYGSMAGIMILLLWLHFCMSMIFYGAEINYFLENKYYYHMLIHIFRPNYRAYRRRMEDGFKGKEAQRRKREKEGKKKNV